MIETEIGTEGEAFCLPEKDSSPDFEPRITPEKSNEKTSVPKFLSIAPLKSKRKLISRSIEKQNERPDVFVDNILPTETKKVATIRKPHNPLKCPIYSNVAGDNETEVK